MAFGLLAATLAGSTGCSDDTGTTPESHVWANKTYILNVPGFKWTKPSDGEFLENFVPQFVLAFGAANGNTLDVTLGAADAAGVQDLCSPTVATTASAPVPGFSLGPVPLFQVQISHPSDPVTVNASITNFKLTNVIPPEGVEASGTLEASVDLRQLYYLFTNVGLGGAKSADEVCATLEGQNESCDACADGAVQCLNLQAEYLSATLWDKALVPVDASVLTSGQCPTTNP